MAARETRNASIESRRCSSAISACDCE